MSIILICSILSCSPDLILVKDKIYHEPGNPASVIAIDTIFLPGFGINDNVVTLPPAARFEVSRLAANIGRVNAPPGYIISDSIVRMVFIGIHGSYGFVDGPSPTHTTILPNETGPAIPVGDSTLITLGPVDSLECGLYKQIMIIDSTDIVQELNEFNNTRVNYFFIPGQNFCSINKNTFFDNLAHDVGPTVTHQFIITPLPGDTCIFAGFSYVTSDGSTATTLPPPPVNLITAPLTVSMEVTPKHHDWPLGEHLSGKITVIGTDGCSIRQENAEVWIEHPHN